MQKQGPSLVRILTMVVFALSCFGLLLFLWVSFGGSVPLRAKTYEVNVNFPEATTVAEAADVRISGVNVGKVQKKELMKGATRTRVTLNIDPRFAPLPKDTHAILRQKTLLGETYVELTPGTPGSGDLADGGTVADSAVEPTVELDEILRIFDPQTKAAFRAWVKSGAASIKNGGGEDLNDALGNFSKFATDGADVLGTLDQQKVALRQLVKNTGVVFGALNERKGQLRSLITTSNNSFKALASQDDALAETFAVFPTFLDESRTTMDRLERFSRNTNPLVNDLKPVADDLGPTVRDLGALAPDLETLFRRLKPLIRVAQTDLPQAERFLRGARPLFKGLHTFLPELNPILSYANFGQTQLSQFLSNGSAAIHYKLGARPDGIPRHTQAQYGMIGPRSLGFQQTRPFWDRGNAYVAPNAYVRAQAMGITESLDCGPVGGTKRDASDTPAEPDNPPCFVAPPSLWDGGMYPTISKGENPLRPNPKSVEGTRPARP